MDLKEGTCDSDLPAQSPGRQGGRDSKAVQSERNLGLYGASSKNLLLFPVALG